MKTIAIIDDDIPIGDMLEEILRKEGHGVLRAYSGTEALYLLSQHRPDLVLLDLMLPGLSGEEVLPKIQGIPVIVVSAKVGIDDKVSLLLGGAADYVTKPFDVKELLARVAVQLRQGANLAAAPVYEAGGLRLDTLSHQATAGGVPVHLTKTEYAILKLLLQHPGKAIANGGYFRPDQRRHAGLYRQLFEAACQQSAAKSSGTPEGKTISRRCGGSVSS